ncbi:unnamed protein product [Trichogramma brassicae]|uniref:NADP-dependent oxidoreductase domain-containing protein n=1 Tax=Trichogramma brassicae TaxID=86971 RepID=A0A6H5HZ82_9HYME|nr:unnamed protein product [Trichogramma brassicae]
MAKTITLSTGYEMPMVGLGTWNSQSGEVEEAVTAALECGYRHIDTAWIYYNEKEIGSSLKKWFDAGGKREDIFITTKLPPHANRASDVKLFLSQSLENLALDYVDMYLIHTPFTIGRNDDYEIAVDESGMPIIDCDTDHLATWKVILKIMYLRDNLNLINYGCTHVEQVMEEEVREGRVRSIGVSNFNAELLQNLIDEADIKPSNLQIEAHAYMQQRELRELCARHDVAVTAYSSLGSPALDDRFKREAFLARPAPLEHPVVRDIAEAHQKTPAQVLLRHLIQEGVAVIPKSVKPERVRENFELYDFELDEDELRRLDELDCGEEGRMIAFNKMFEGYIIFTFHEFNFRC